jgi:hypothetical protein
MAERQNGGMAERQNSGMAGWYFTTYLIYPAIFMVHNDDADDDADDNANDTNGF